MYNNFTQRFNEMAEKDGTKENKFTWKINE